MSQWFRTSQALNETAKKPESDGIGYNGSYLKQIKLEEAATPLLFVEGAYPSYADPSIKLPYFEWPRHTFKDTVNGKPFIRSFLCAKGKDRSIHCPSCELQYDKEDKRFSTRRMRYFTVIALDWFYLHTNDYNDEIYRQPETPSQRRQWDEQGVKRVFGRVGYLELGPGHAGQLIDLAKQIGQTCAMCIEKDKRAAKLTPSKYVCEACNRTIEDMETTDKTKKELEQLAGEVYACKCGHRGLLHIEYECERCQDPRPAEIFDVVIPLAKRGKDTDTSIVVPHGADITFIDHVQIPFEGGQVPLFDGTQFHESISSLYTPLNFHELFKVERNPAFHQKMIGLANTRTTIAPPPRR
jgi:hypothetical protein